MRIDYSDHDAALPTFGPQVHATGPAPCSTVIAVLGGLLGVGGGYLLGAMFQRAALRTGLFAASVPIAQLVLAVAGLAVVGVAAAAWPARRAAKANLLAAIAAE
jgi:putative ABC transport system permease protein